MYSRVSAKNSNIKADKVEWQRLVQQQAQSYTMQWLRLHDMGFRLEVELERVEPEGEWEGNCNSSCTRKKNIRQGSYTA